MIEGLLDGLEGEAREARRGLLEDLADRGASTEELSRAVAEDRLVLMPVERVLTESLRMSAVEVAALCGLDPDFVTAVRHALGLAHADPDDALFREADVEAFRRLGALRRDAHIPDEGLLEVVRVLGHGLWRTSEAILSVVAEALARDGDNELAIGARYAEAARTIGPLGGPFLSWAMHAHIVEGVRGEALTAAEIDSGEIDDTAEVGVCFVDLVGYTSIGEHGALENVLGVAGRLADAAAEVARAPVRLVKTIGDAAMLVSTDVEALVRAVGEMLDLVDADEALPPARAGLAHGTALTRGGDWYGRPVNLASRVSAVARPGVVLATEAVRDRAAGRWSAVGEKSLKGVEEAVKVYELDRAGR